MEEEILCRIMINNKLAEKNIQNYFSWIINANFKKLIVSKFYLIYVLFLKLIL